MSKPILAFFPTLLKRKFQTIQNQRKSTFYSLNLYFIQLFNSNSKLDFVFCCTKFITIKTVHPEKHKYFDAANNI